MKAYRSEVRRQAAALGRDPDKVKLLFLAYPIVDITMEAAQERRRLERLAAEENIDMLLSSMSRLTGIDFSQFPIDEPLPSHLTTNGHQSALAKWIGKTPRSIVKTYASKAGIDFTGTVDHVAGMMQEIMEEVGGDGFLIFNTYFDRRYIMEICEGLVPELQRRGLTRKAYAHKHLRDNLLEF
jgi:long-chain alkane monooxygenase